MHSITYKESGTSTLFHITEYVCIFEIDKEELLTY